MAWYEGLLDPTTAQGMRFAGLLGGLGTMGQGLMAAGAPRPLGQPGPGLADAFGAFGQGQQRAFAGAYQNADMARRMARQGDLAAATSAKPDEELTPTQRTLRSALSTLPENVRSLADPDQLGGLVVQRETQRVTPIDPARAQQLGLRPGTVAFENAWTGAPSVLQQPDYKSPEAEAQAIRIAGASRAAPLPVEVNGRLIDPRTGRVVYDGGGGQPLSPANAWNEILRYAPAVAAGQLDASTPEGQRYLAAQTILTQPRPVQITQPDGSVVQVMQQPDFPFPRLQMPGGGAAPPPAAQGAAAPPAPGAAPAPAPASGVVVKPPPPLTEAQGNATMYLQRMQAAEKRLAETEATGYKPGGTYDAIAGSIPLAGNFLMSERGQNYKQAQEDWVRAKLRKESGAVIAKEEMAAEIKAYFPQPGDSASTIARKAEARRTAMDALGASAGPGVGRMTTTAPATPATPADPLGILR